jgi:hypothetical protein
VSRRWKRTLIAAALGAGAVLGCGDDPVEPPPQTLFAPESWAGVWDITFIERECDSDILVDSFPTLETICTGESLVEFLLGDAEGELDCTGSWTDSSLEATCSGSSTVLGCITTVAARFDASLRADSTFAGLVRLDVRFDCEDEIPDDCLDVELDAVLRAAEPDSCPQPATGALKALTRATRPQR